MSGTNIDILNPQNSSESNSSDLGSKEKVTRVWSEGHPQKYIGEILHGSIHGRGFYFTEDGDKIFYDGLFYANKVEGYAQVFYNNGCNFQGLFKSNLRFGPGVLTYPDGTQDVGLWTGQSLNRLGGLNKENLVPRLAATSKGQLKLMKYRYLVPVCPKRIDVAYDLLRELGASERVLQKSHQLYNLEVGNKRSIFFNKNLFDKNFYTDQDCSIDIVLSDQDQDSQAAREEDQQQIREESPSSSPIHAERIKQISQELETIQGKLREAERKRVLLEEKVKVCQTCCHYHALHEGGSGEGFGMGVSESIEESEEIEISDKTEVLRKSVRSAKTVTSSKSSQEVDLDDLTFYDDVDDDNLSSPNPTTEVTQKSETTDVMSQIKDYLMNTCVCDELMAAGGLHEMEQELEIARREEIFYKSIWTELSSKLKMHQKKSVDTNEVKTMRILVKDVLAWNNEEFCMRMLKQSFRHRKSEYMVSFNVADLIAGHRNKFREPGPLERHSINFLHACSKGDTQSILRHVKDNDVDVNVCDSKGNSGVFFAAVNRRTEAIKMLVNLGAKIDVQNDEGLLPLTMCFLMYLAEKHNVTDWEKSFLPDVEPTTEQKEAYKFYPNMSLLNLLPKTKASLKEVVSSKDIGSNSGHEKRNYLFDTSYVIPKDEEPPFKERKLSVSRYVGFPHFEKTHDDKLSIENSIKTLLNCGANPNAGAAPLPSLILSLFTENLNLVMSVLMSNADVNITIEEEMTALHVVASMKCAQINVDICNTLLEYGCDPRQKTSSNHWAEQKAHILGKVSKSSVEDLGKNPLHILCMRKDFPLDNCSYFQQMAEALGDSTIDYNEKYLGHTPLSLAALVGNRALVETLMKLQLIDPHQLLGCNMGNVLTIYILQRYEDLLPPNAKNIMERLVELGANPLNPVGQFENSIAFMEKEHEVPKTPKERIKPPTESLTKVKEIKNVEKPKNWQLRSFLKELGRRTIIKYIQLRAVENLYNMIEENLMGHRYAVVLAEFLTADVVIPNLQYLFKHGKIKSERYDKSICLQLIELVTAYQLNFKHKKKSKDLDSSEPKNKSKLGVTRKLVIRTSDFGHVLDMTDFKKLKKNKSKLKIILPPGLDNTSKYRVCFHCLIKQNKLLKVCPRCQLIYFCSSLCNKANMALQTPHPCNINFYASHSKSSEPPTIEDDEDLAELFKRIRVNCEARWQKKVKELRELARKQFQEEMRADTYGLKWMKVIGRKGHNLKRTDTNETLLGSACDLTKFGSTEGADYVQQRAYDSVANETFSGILRTDPSTRQLTKKTINIAPKKLSLETQPKKTSAVRKSCPHTDHTHENECECHQKGKETKSTLEGKVEPKTAPKTNVVVKELRTVPTRYQQFMELLTGYFPDVDFSALFLPYTCYSNGHLYYKFLDRDLYARSYTMM